MINDVIVDISAVKYREGPGIDPERWPRLGGLAAGGGRTWQYCAGVCLNVTWRPPCHSPGLGPARVLLSIYLTHFRLDCLGNKYPLKLEGKMFIIAAVIKRLKDIRI